MDTIKREDAIRIAEYPQIGALTKEERVSLIMDIPSAEKQGEWIGKGDYEAISVKCSICGRDNGLSASDFCPNCGARMK